MNKILCDVVAPPFLEPGVSHTLVLEGLLIAAAAGIILFFLRKGKKNS